jgi:hypothetical protein
MNESIIKIINGLRELADSLEGTLKNEIGSEKANSNKEPKIEIITIEKVRSVLSNLSQEGKQGEVKALIQKYGAEKLTALDPACYPELLKEAEEL